MRKLYQRFFETLSRPLSGRSRILLALLVIPIGLSFTVPLWRISMVAPQYPDGLALDIYAHTVEGDIQEINTLNHYIGMGRIDRASLSDLDWIPFALGVLALLVLRVAAIGTVRWLIDVTVLFVYFSLFALGRFYYKLWWFGHNLDPTAPFKMEPFTPAILGTKQIANFTTTSLPAGASFCLGIFAIGVIGIAAWEIASGMRAAAAGAPTRRESLVSP